MISHIGLISRFIFLTVLSCSKTAGQLVATENSMQQLGEYKPQDLLKEGANICMHDLEDLDCQSPQWRYSKQPTKKRVYFETRSM